MHVNCKHFQPSEKTPRGGGRCAIDHIKDPSFGACMFGCDRRERIEADDAVFVQLAVKPTAPQPPGGVGTEIKKLLASLGIKAEGCGGCAASAALWDRNGIEWCEARIDELVSTLTARAKEKNWLLGVGARLGARALVDRAITNAKAVQSP